MDTASSLIVVELRGSALPPRWTAGPERSHGGSVVVVAAAAASGSHRVRQVGALVVAEGGCWASVLKLSWLSLAVQRGMDWPSPSAIAIGMSWDWSLVR